MTVHTDRLKRNTHTELPSDVRMLKPETSGLNRKNICKWAFKSYSKQFQYQIIKLNYLSSEPYFHAP